MANPFSERVLVLTIRTDATKEHTEVWGTLYGSTEVCKEDLLLMQVLKDGYDLNFGLADALADLLEAVSSKVPTLL